ncbi:uncharacterized protein LOC134210951 [Armigeres subalbatus]|uniref:uncharacterized protein LOC134210951 n=1 Tax=Armigeres subalbatus TaxID=124917 RepID=UPI002ED57927
MVTEGSHGQNLSRAEPVSKMCFPITTAGCLWPEKLGQLPASLGVQIFPLTLSSKQVKCITPLVSFTRWNRLSCPQSNTEEPTSLNCTSSLNCAAIIGNDKLQTSALRRAQLNNEKK